MTATLHGTPLTPITFGPMQVDWETRIDFEKMRRDRLQRARDAMAKAGVDYLILSRQENCRYVTSVKRLYWPTIRLGGGPIVVLPREGAPALWNVDPDFTSKALTWLPADRFREGPEMDLESDVETFVREAQEIFGSDLQRARIGVDIWSGAMYSVLPTKLAKAKFSNGQEVMRHARKIKTQEEIVCMKVAYAISEAGMQAAVEALKPGVRECELVGACFHKFWELGSETSQCSQAVNSGPATLPYRRFHTDRIILAGEIVNMDFGACFNGYFGDFCRPFVCGKRPSAAQADLFKRAYDLQMKALDMLRPGVSPAELCRKFNCKMLGHGVGISAFEEPHLRSVDDYLTESGMTFSVITHMKASNPALGSAHVEDEIVMTDDGCDCYSTYPYTGVND